MRARTERAAAVLALALLSVWIYRPVLRGEALAGRDVFRMAIPDGAFILESLRRLELPLWLPYSRLGQPFLATLQSQALYPPRVLAAFLFGQVWAPAAEQVLHGALACAGAWVAARSLGCRRLAAASGGAAFGLSHLMVMLASEPNMAGAAAWSGWIVAAARAPGGRWRAAALTGLAVGASLLCGSPETTLWQGVMALACARGRGRWLSSGVGLAWGAAVAAIAVIPGLELAAHSVRAQGHSGALAWSASVTQLAAMVVPHADWPRAGYGDGEQWLLLSTFTGALPFALAAWAAFRGRRAWIRPVVAVSIVLLLLSLGEHFAPSAAVLEWTPLRWFRYPSKYLVGAAFGIALLAAAGVDRFAAAARRGKPSARRSAVALVGMAAAAAAARAWLPAGGVWVVAFVGTAMLLLQALPRRARRWGCVAPAALLLAELVTAHAVLGGPAFVSAARLAEPSALAEEVRTPHGRVSLDVQPRLDRAPNAEGVLEFIARSRGALVPQRHVEEGLRAAEGYGTPEPERTDALFERGGHGAYDLAAVEWFVRAGKEPEQNPTALPRARWVGGAEEMTDDEALEAIAENPEALRGEAFLAEGGDDSLESDCESGPVELVRDEARVVEVAVDACGPGYLILADRFYPGWHATVDGREAPIYRADYAVRAVPLPEEGHHVVRFEYRPATVRAGAIISAVATALALAVLLVRWRWRWRESR
ncbi:MAG TPA: YfhO family protein [Myxococcales bacterium]|nr:YfhO family protein [Myxococcales bacterium]